MPSKNMNNELIVILGPTAVGKTKISLDLAEKFNGEIISGDSRLFYRGMDIGTAKPSHIDLAKIKHHLVDVSDPDENWSLAVYQNAAYAAIDEINSKGKIPFLVGGTGQYLKAVYQGWKIPQVKPNTELRLALEKWANEIGVVGLYERLVSIDPDAGEFIEPNNLRRTIRAFEVILCTGRKFSSTRTLVGTAYNTLILGLTMPRKELFNRIDLRITLMIDNGFIDEVRSLMLKGYSPALPSFSTIGYRQIANYINGEISLDDAIMLIKRLSRKLVRRQANWFKMDDPEIKWFQSNDKLLYSMSEEIKKFLNQI